MDTEVMELHSMKPAFLPGLPVEAYRTGSRPWHELRRTGLGGSDPAALLQLSDYVTRYELWLTKTGRIPLQPEQDMSEPQRWGNLLEPVVTSRYCEVRQCRLVNTKTTTWRSQRHPFMLANFDGLVLRGDSDARVLEVKTSRSSDGWGEPGSDEVPLPYLLQVQHYMVVSDLPLADIAVLIGGSDFRVYTIRADRELQAMLVEAEREFWELVVTDTEPPIDNLPDIKRKYGSLATKGTAKATEEDLVTLARLKESHQLIKELETSTDEGSARIMKRLGEQQADMLVHPTTGKPLVTWRLPAAPMRFDTEAFGAAHPVLLAQYTRPGKASRRLLLK